MKMKFIKSIFIGLLILLNTVYSIETNLITAKIRETKELVGKTNKSSIPIYEIPLIVKRDFVS
jgi:hypothetical protein